MSKTILYDTLEYIQKDRELLSIILKNALCYSLIKDIMVNSEPPHTKLAKIHEVINEN